MEATASAPSATPEASTAPVETSSAPVTDSQPAEIPRIGESSETLLSKDTPQTTQPSADLLGGVASQPEITTTGTVPEIKPENMNWLDRHGISGELRGNPNISKYNSLEDALNANINLVKKLGEKGIMRPDENSDQATWDAWYDHVGRPQNADGYSDFEPPTMKDAEGNDIQSFEIDEKVYGEAKKTFHELGLTDAQHKGVMELFANTSMNQAEQDVGYRAEEAKQTRAMLEKEFGAEMNAKLKSAKNVADKLGIFDVIRDKGLANDFSVIMALNSIVDKVGESRLTGDVSPAGGGFDAEIKQIQSNPAYRDKSHPDYQTLHQREIDLYAKRYN